MTGTGFSLLQKAQRTRSLLHTSLRRSLWTSCAARGKLRNISQLNERFLVAWKTSSLLPINQRRFVSDERPSNLRNKQKIGPINIYSAILFVVTGLGLYFYFDFEQKKARQRRIDIQNQAIGKPHLGGSFSLVDHDGNQVTDKDFRGKFMLIYFGFTRCPDVCPEELDKMADLIEIVKKVSGDIMTPIFITCDPWRDTPERVKEYLAEFHNEIIGITGSYENIKKVCKTYRVYFSTPPNVDPNKDDYLVDHSLFMYLMDPQGEFVEVFGKNATAEEIALRICDNASKYNSLKT